MSPFLGTRGAGTNKAFGFAGAAAPNQVTGLSATDFGTSRAYNNGRIDLSWNTPANNGATISGYLIQRSTDGSTYSTLVANTGSSATTYSDTSLLSAQIYYYKVSAINAAGTGLASTAANATATTVPQAPTIGTATAVTASSATITYTANATGGKTVSTYTATSSPGSITGTGSSPITVSGLTTGTAYTFTVTATNANGTSTVSAASNSVTPDYQDSFESIATITGSGASITFSSIPQTYKYLELRITNARTLSSGTGLGDYVMTFNGDTSSKYYYAGFNALNTSATANGGTTPTSNIRMYYNIRDNSATGQASTIINLHNYTDTAKTKIGTIYSGGYNVVNPTMNALSNYSFVYDTTNAISSITLAYQGGNNLNGGTFTLYGMKG